MTDMFSLCEGPHDNPHQPGSGPGQQAQRQLRRRAHRRGAGPDDSFGHGHGGGRGRDFGPGPRGGRVGRGRGHRSRRGDVRTAILALLAERPMHGYEMIQQIAERSGQVWRPSPGSVYPTLQLLADEGLIVATETDGSRKSFALTDEGQAAATKTVAPPWEQMADGVDPGQASLR
ncbi:MAG TPA: PadR family transcriptional regulator, partial [Mycobacterium sp.]|nr:PadR family transcriptional regulator [Mycobacterium sp.]